MNLCFSAFFQETVVDSSALPAILSYEERIEVLHFIDVLETKRKIVKKYAKTDLSQHLF
jgi:hypothetical protein